MFKIGQEVLVLINTDGIKFQKYLGKEGTIIDIAEEDRCALVQMYDGVLLWKSIYELEAKQAEISMEAHADNAAKAMIKVLEEYNKIHNTGIVLANFALGITKDCPEEEISKVSIKGFNSDGEIISFDDFETESCRGKDCEECNACADDDFEPEEDEDYNEDDFDLDCDGKNCEECLGCEKEDEDTECCGMGFDEAFNKDMAEFFAENTVPFYPNEPEYFNVLIQVENPVDISDIVATLAPLNLEVIVTPVFGDE